MVTIQVNIPGDAAVPSFPFQHIAFHKDGSVWTCEFTCAGCDIANIRIPSLTIENVVAAMAEASRAAYAYARPDMPVHNFQMTVNKGNGHG